ncbi:MAG TPA: carboxylesterase family protein [Desulfobacterales bacterium]|nr:carboxylesterase family protein [Desulfobacterales bacterium]
MEHTGWPGLGSPRSLPRTLTRVVLAGALLCLGTTGLAAQKVPAWAVRAWTGDSVVGTRFGNVKGFPDANDTLVWKAIPYARPPVCELRWRAPQDPAPWLDIRSERSFNDGCTQYEVLAANKIRGSEDCLYLNVWRPRDAETGLPVYVFIHGGGNSIGWATQIADYEGSRLTARSRMVFVSFNYRLGPFGWFTHPALRTGQSALDASGNYGLLDMIKALEWVRDNIKAFGGDPKRVTLTGHSAGAMDVLALLIAPKARGLFQRAMAMSGVARTSTVAEADLMSRSVIEQLLVADGTATTRAEADAATTAMSATALAAYLRGKSDREILRTYGSPVRGIIANPDVLNDGTVIPLEGFSSFATGRYASRVPLILGGNREELKLFLESSRLIPWQGELYQAVVKYGTARWRAFGVDEVAHMLVASTGQPPVYTYRFDWGAPDAEGTSVLPGAWGKRLGAFHGLDVPFFLGNDTILGALQAFLFTPENEKGRKELSAAMMEYLAAFARTGNPNPPGSKLPKWQPWSTRPGTMKALVFDAGPDALAIRISTTELTDASVLKAANAELVEPLRGNVLRYLDQMKNPWSLR